MESSDYLDGVLANAGLFAYAARHAGLSAPVPTCPEWAVADLVRHQARIFRWVSAIIEGRAQDYVDPKTLVAMPDGADLVGWLEDSANVALSVLEHADPAAPVWNWSAGRPAPAAFWFRRLAHETAVHRADAEAAAGMEGPVDPPALAADGIDEFLELMPTIRARSKRLSSLRGSYHFHTTDTPGEWVAEFGAMGSEVRREHAKADVALRGAASDLLLFMVSRRGPEGLEVLGDVSLVPAWTADIRF